MMPNTEDIEARLCAYIEGELDAAGRAEIERHLSTNPQHRKLINDLSQQRDLLAALPRVRAPLDVAETLNAQLERSALLTDEDDWRDRHLRISRWPQLKAAAAVLLLVSGLAAGVYYVVPSPNRLHSELLATMPGGGDSSPEPLVADPLTEPTGTVLTGRGLPDTDRTALTAQQERTLLALGNAIPDSHKRRVMSNATLPQHQILGHALTDAPSEGAGIVMTVLVDAPDPFAAEQHVQQYFQNKQMPLEMVDAAMLRPLALDPSQAAMGARQNQKTQVAMRDASEDFAGIPPIPGGPQAAEAGPAQSRSGLPGGSFVSQTPLETPESVEAPAVDSSEINATVTATVQATVQAQASQRMFRTRLTRSELDTLCSSISDRASAQVAQIVSQPGKEAAPPRVPLRQPAAAAVSLLGEGGILGQELDSLVQEFREWKLASILPWVGDARKPEAAELEAFNVLPPGVQSDFDDERMDAYIIVRAESQPAAGSTAGIAGQSQADQTDQAVQDAPRDQPIPEPAASPATRPSD
jgi:hypothetical protein